MREAIEPETVYVEHNAKEALFRMDAENMNHICVVDGDLVVGVLSREPLRESLQKDPDAKLHDIMEETVLVFSSGIGRGEALKALNFHKAPYALIVDDRMQLRELVERESSNGETIETAAGSAPGRFIDLVHNQQTGAIGEPDKVYTVRPHIEKETET